MKTQVEQILDNLIERQSQLLIDGKLVAGSAGTFPTVNPATEEVLGVAADATVDDMGEAIGAARRALDHGGWPRLEPHERMGKPEDVANAVKFLVSEDAAYITGQVLAVNGGMYM